MSGWIKLHRSITDHWLYTEKRVYSRFEAWNDILLTVNYSDAKTIIKGKMYTIKRGESILSLESWSKRWNWDKSKVRRFFSLLQTETGEPVTESFEEIADEFPEAVIRDIIKSIDEAIRPSYQDAKKN